MAYKKYYMVAISIFILDNKPSDQLALGKNVQTAQVSGKAVVVNTGSKSVLLTFNTENGK